VRHTYSYNVGKNELKKQAADNLANEAEFPLNPQVVASVQYAFGWNEFGLQIYGFSLVQRQWVLMEEINM